jgi:hypothetical protein
LISAPEKIVNVPVIDPAESPETATETSPVVLDLYTPEIELGDDRPTNATVPLPFNTTSEKELKRLPPRSGIAPPLIAITCVAPSSNACARGFATERSVSARHGANFLEKGCRQIFERFLKRGRCRGRTEQSEFSPKIKLFYPAIRVCSGFFFTLSINTIAYLAVPTTSAPFAGCQA